MTSSVRNAAAAFIAALVLSLNPACAFMPQSLGDAVTATSTRIPTMESVMDFVKAKSLPDCRMEDRTDQGVVFSGACFGFPREEGSRFAVNGLGDVVRSEIYLADRTFADNLKRGLVLLYGDARTVPSYGTGWLVGGEFWSFEEASKGSVFIRVLYTDKEKELKRYEERLNIALMP